jgi:CheY-like chemotaxis protein
LTSVRPRERAIPSVLLVEDDDTDVMFVQRCIAYAGDSIALVVARDGEEALELLGSTTIMTRPYVIVTDLNMPGMSGHELIERIRADVELSDSVIFVLSSSRLEEDIERSYTQHVAGYISKDMSTGELTESIRNLISFCKSVYLPN